MPPENKLARFNDRAAHASIGRRSAPNPAVQREFEKFKAFEAGRAAQERREYDRQLVDANAQLVRTVDAKLTGMERRRRAR
jgi:hypothetical protein